MPEPSFERERAPSTRWKRSNTVSRCSRAMPMPVSRTVTRAMPPAASTVTAMPPSNVNLNAFDRRFRTIFSHMPTSSRTGCGNGAQRTSNARPALSITERKPLARSAVNAGKSTGATFACMRPACTREKSSSVFTSRSSRSALRRTSCSRSRWAAGSGSSASARLSSSGPSISVSGVRNSWLTLLKNVVLARSSSASMSIRRRCSSMAPAFWMAAVTWAATRSKNVRYSASSRRTGLTPSTSAPSGRACPGVASGSTSAWRSGWPDRPAGRPSTPSRSTSSGAPARHARVTGNGPASAPSPSCAGGQPAGSPAMPRRRSGAPASAPAASASAAYSSANGRSAGLSASVPMAVAQAPATVGSRSASADSRDSVPRRRAFSTPALTSVDGQNRPPT